MMFRDDRERLYGSLPLSDTETWVCAANQNHRIIERPLGGLSSRLPRGWYGLAASSGLLTFCSKRCLVDWLAQPE